MLLFWKLNEAQHSKPQNIMQVFTLSLNQIKRNIFAQYMGSSLCVDENYIRNSLDDLMGIIMALHRKDSDGIINYFMEGNSNLALTPEMSKEIQDCGKECVLIIKDEGNTLFAISSNQIKFA